MKLLSKHRTITLLISIIICTSLLLPTSRLYDFNYKIALFFGLLIALFPNIIDSGLTRESAAQLLGFGIFIIFYSIIAQLNDVSLHDTLSEGVAFGGVFLIIWIALLLVNKKIITVSYILYAIIYFSALASLVKIVEFIVLISGYPLNEMLADSKTIFGNYFIGMPVGNLFRISLGSDNILPIILFTLLANNKLKLNISVLIKYAIILLTILSIAISYSRYLWFESFFAIFLQILYIKRSKGYGKPLLYLILFLLFFIFILNNINFILLRYDGINAQASDMTRVEMLRALIEQINIHPIIGSGLGASTLGFTNIKSIPWYYELQWLSFTMQFGFFGLVLLLSAALLVAVKQLSYKTNVNYIGLTCMYFLWLCTGIFNGFMLTSAGAIIFLYFYLIIKFNSENTINARK